MTRQTIKPTLLQPSVELCAAAALAQHQSGRNKRELLETISVSPHSTIQYKLTDKLDIMRQQEGGRQKCEERIGLVLMQYGGSRAL